MGIIINSIGGGTRAIVEPNEDVYQEKRILGNNAVQLAFDLPFYTSFAVGDYATIFSETYYITTPAVVKKVGNRNYAYQLDLEGEQHKLGRTQYQKPNGIGQFRNSTFFINSTADTFVLLLIDNMNRAFPDDGWELGYVVADGTVKNLAFDGVNCLEALNTLAEAFDTEWLVEGRKVHLYRKSAGTGLVLRYGEDEALYSITRAPQDNSNPVTRLYAYGSGRNLPFNYRNGDTRLSLGALTYIDKYIEQFGLWEDTQIFEDIYPKFTGEVTSVDENNELVFTDVNIPFNVNNILADGITAKVVFETGQLAGYELEINNFDDGTKTFTLNKNAQETALDVPGELMRPEVGDKYIVVDIRMPNEFVAAAEAELLQRANDWLDRNVLSSLSYQVECNPIYFKQNGFRPALGDSMTVIDSDMGINEQLRVVAFTRNLRDPNVYGIELAKRAKESEIVRLFRSIG